MGQSLVKNYSHIIFSTKHRQPFIQPPFDIELYAYIASICKTYEFIPLKVGGHVDHIHILCLLSKKNTLIKFMQELKSSTSKWVKTKGDNLKSFYWQDGYGSFSVGQDGLDGVIKYIENQNEHHKKKTFQEEYREFLNNYNVEYDERYVWD
ncbi:IS200/IS605 family transposase [soil metagenome]